MGSHSNHSQFTYKIGCVQIFGQASFTLGIDTLTRKQSKTMQFIQVLFGFIFATFFSLKETKKTMCRNIKVKEFLEELKIKNVFFFGIQNL